MQDSRLVISSSETLALSLAPAALLPRSCRDHAATAAGARQQHGNIMA